MTRPDYGVDAPRVVITMLGGGALAAIAGFALAPMAAPMAPTAWRAIIGTLRFGGLAWVATGAMMLLSSRVGKLRLRDRVLDALSLSPDARVLDVGCGHGVLLIGAAKRVPNGGAVGVDLWSQRDQHDNSRDATLRNAEREGVRERVEVRDADMRALPFPDASFDAVVSSLAVHNVEGAEERARAIREMVRVLRPEGRIALVDIAHTSDYARVLRDAGMHDVRVRVTPWIFPPARVVTGTRV